MNYQLSFEESSDLRAILEDHLITVFADNTISKHLQIKSPAPEVQSYPQIKLAHAIWLGMHVADRCAVLGKFSALYQLYSDDPAGNKTMAFCALFVNDLASILAEASQWPH